MIAGATAREIATSAEAGIREGSLLPGETLPTIRALAASLETSPATVNAAYRMLRERGLVVAAGRRGTRVAPRPALRVPSRTRESQTTARRGDLSAGFPDPALLPPLAPALARIELDEPRSFTSLDANDPNLLALAAASFAADRVPTQALTVVSGALDGIERVLAAHVRPGDRVLIEDPAYPPLRDLLTALGLTEIGVPVDDDGFMPEAFGAALRRGVQAVVSTPRAQNPYGSAISRDRATELQSLLGASSGPLVIEDDHASVVSGARYTGLMPDGWARWAVVRSVSKVLHPDLRLAFLAGDETTVARVEGRQWLGARWVSHILQATVAELLADPGFTNLAERATETYARRRTALIEALAERGLEAHGRSGLNVWVPVPDEAPVSGAVLDAGWLVLAGERCRLATAPAIRVTTAVLAEEDAPALADAIVAATRVHRARAAY